MLSVGEREGGNARGTYCGSLLDPAELNEGGIRLRAGWAVRKELTLMRSRSPSAAAIQMFFCSDARVVIGK